MVGGAAVVALLLAVLAAIYGPETANLVNGATIERDNPWTEADKLQAIQECFQERERRQNKYEEAYGKFDIRTEPLWTFVPDDEVRYELWKESNSPRNYDRVRAVRVRADRLVAAMSNVGETFGVEMFPDRRYLFSVDRIDQETFKDQESVTSSGTLKGPWSDTGDWRITTNISSGTVLGTINASDSWISIHTGSEDDSLTFFGEIDQCRRAQRLREMGNDIMSSNRPSVSGRLQTFPGPENVGGSVARSAALAGQKRSSTACCYL